MVSPFLSSLGLERHGLRWLWPELDLAHPLDDGRAGVLSRDLDRTLASLGTDAAAWRGIFEHLTESFDSLVPDILRPVAHVPTHPITLARFGLDALRPATSTVRRFADEPARALFMGAAAHAFGRLDTALSAAVGLVLVRRRAPRRVAGGAGRLPVDQHRDGRAARRAGRPVRTGVAVRDLDQVRDALGAEPDVVLLDTAPDAAVRILGDRMPARVRRALRRYRYGPAAHKVDLAIDGDVPWTNEDCRHAGTVHVGGTAAEIVAAEAAIVRGRIPERPFVLVGQQYLADPSRSRDGLNPLWAYAHVPHGYHGDVTEAVVAQIERFAPGFRDRIVATSARTAPELARYNPNYVGGDISAGANSARQTVLRPRLALNPYALGVPGVYLCSSATPPGAGVHGMCGANAAEAALARL